jgi:hypothetical protein
LNISLTLSVLLAPEYFLGKRRDQEELYCTFRPRDVNEAGRCRSVSKAKIVELARKLEDFADIRFIVLTRIAPMNKVTEKGMKARRGSWVGLQPANNVVRGYDSLAAASPRQLPPPPHGPPKKRKALVEVAPTQCTFQRTSPFTVLEDDLPLEDDKPAEDDKPFQVELRAEDATQEPALEPTPVTFLDQTPESILKTTPELTYPRCCQPEDVTDIQLL